jgi:hypothetical protein
MLSDGPYMSLRMTRARLCLPLMLPRSLVKRLALLATLLLVVALPALAEAQTTTGVTVTVINATSLPRLDANLQAVAKRSSSLNPEGVNLQDCRDNQFISFPLSIAGTGNLIGEIWATDTGAACSDALQRNGAGVAQCWKIASARFVITPTQTVNINVKEMIKGLGDQSAITDAFGCRQINLSTIDVWFLPLSGSVVSGAAADIPIKVSTLGPQPLSGVRALPGDTRISVAWDSVGEGGAADVLGVNAYCDANPTPATTISDGGTADVCTTVDADVDADAADTPEPTCTTVVTPAGTVVGDPIPQPPNMDSNGKLCATAAFTPASGKTITPDRAFNDKYLCGSVTGTGNTVVVSGVGGGALSNGKTYAVAVAATDSFGNVGQLSAPICQYPEATSDFWRDYRNSGGQSGGGFCSVEGPGLPVGSFAAIGMGIVVGASAWRRRRRDRRAGGAGGARGRSVR